MYEETLKIMFREKQRPKKQTKKKASKCVLLGLDCGKIETPNNNSLKEKTYFSVRYIVPGCDDTGILAPFP